jgi:hypothetical protein
MLALTRVALAALGLWFMAGELAVAGCWTVTVAGAGRGPLASDCSVESSDIPGQGVESSDKPGQVVESSDKPGQVVEPSDKPGQGVEPSDKSGQKVWQITSASGGDEQSPLSADLGGSVFPVDNGDAHYICTASGFGQSPTCRRRFAN